MLLHTNTKHYVTQCLVTIKVERPGTRTGTVPNKQKMLATFSNAHLNKFHIVNILTKIKNMQYGTVNLDVL